MYLNRSLKWAAQLTQAPFGARSTIKRHSACLKYPAFPSEYACPHNILSDSRLVRQTVSSKVSQIIRQIARLTQFSLLLNWSRQKLGYRATSFRSRPIIKRRPACDAR
jgi:hypothetical protein